MDIHARRLVRLAELLYVSAGVLRDILACRDFDGENGNLEQAATSLDLLSIEVKRIGFSDCRCESGETPL